MASAAGVVKLFHNTSISKSKTTNQYSQWLILKMQFYSVSQKNIPNIFDCNLKQDYQILTIFW